METDNIVRAAVDMSVKVMLLQTNGNPQLKEKINALEKLVEVSAKSLSEAYDFDANVILFVLGDKISKKSVKDFANSRTKSEDSRKEM